MSNQLLKLYKPLRASASIKPCNVYADTHEKLISLSQESQRTRYKNPRRYG